MKKSKYILKILLVLGVCILLSGVYCAWVIHTSTYTIPFELNSDKVYIKAHVNGNNVRFLYDTGAYYSYIDRYYFATFTKGKSLWDSGTTLPLIELSSISFSSCYFSIADDGMYFKNHNAVGIIGNEFFKDYIVYLGMDNHTITLYRSSPFVWMYVNFINKVQGFERVPNAIQDKVTIYVPALEDKKIINYAVEDRGKIYLPVKFKDNLIKKLVFDLGLEEGLFLGNEFIDVNKIQTSANKIKWMGHGARGKYWYEKSRINSITIGADKIHNMVTTLSPDGPSGVILSNNYPGYVGMEVIKRFNWYIDYPRKTLAFKKNRLFNSEIRFYSSGIRYEIDYRKIYVLDVFKNTPGIKPVLRKVMSF